VAPPLCSGSGGTDAAQDTRARDARDSGAPEAHAAGLGINDVFSDLLGIAGLSYSIFSGNSSSKQLSSIESSLSTMQNEMVAIQNSLAQLQTQIANVNANVLQGNVSDLAADAQPTVDAIKVDGEDINALVGALYQVVCPSTGCATMRLAPPATVTSAFNAICYPNGKINRTLAEQCNNVAQAEYNALLAIKGQKPAQAINNLAEYSLGSAGVTEPRTAGIVQYELEAGAPSDGFFQTQNAASARLEWGYYTIASIWAQTTFAEAAGMSIGQPEPGTNQKHPPLLTPTAAKNGVNALNPTIDAFMGAFPNMPDTAVINTNTNAADSDPPTMWAQRVGGLSVWDAFAGFANVPWDLNDGGGIASSGSGMAANPLSNSDQAPIVMTPAASSGKSWVMLPASGVGTVPSMSSARFGDWQPGQGTVSSSNNQMLDGPLGDLYGQAPGYSTSAAQTRGQWMTTNSGINPQLLTVTGMGYGAATMRQLARLQHVRWHVLLLQLQPDRLQQRPERVGCRLPAGGRHCLPAPHVLQQRERSLQRRRLGHGDRDRAVRLQPGTARHQPAGSHHRRRDLLPDGGGPFNTDSSQWVNQWGNFAGQWCYKSNECYPGVMPLIDTAAGASNEQAAAFTTGGRPILFDRTQVAAGGSTPNSDCFFWNGDTNSAADGTGCMVKRTTSTQILPAAPSGY
jgi:hypothetical protein